MKVSSFYRLDQNRWPSEISAKIDYEAGQTGAWIVAINLFLRSFYSMVRAVLHTQETKQNHTSIECPLSALSTRAMYLAVVTTLGQVTTIAPSSQRGECAVKLPLYH